MKKPAKTPVKNGIYKLALKLPDGSAWLFTPAEGEIKQLFAQSTTPSAPTPRLGS